MNIDLKNLAVTVGACGTIFTGVWYFTAPAFDAHISDLIKSYVDSREFKRDQKDIALEASEKVFLEFLKSDDFEKVLQDYLSENNSNSVTLRHLLAVKMDMPEEDVADAIASLYNKDSKRLVNVLRILNREYPDDNVWIIPQ